MPKVGLPVILRFLAEADMPASVMVVPVPAIRMVSFVRVTRLLYFCEPVVVTLPRLMAVAPVTSRLRTPEIAVLPKEVTLMAGKLRVRSLPAPTMPLVVVRVLRPERVLLPASVMAPV